MLCILAGYLLGRWVSGKTIASKIDPDATYGNVYYHLQQADTLLTTAEPSTTQCIQDVHQASLHLIEADKFTGVLSREVLVSTDLNIFHLESRVQHLKNQATALVGTALSEGEIPHEDVQVLKDAVSRLLSQLPDPQSQHIYTRLSQIPALDI